MRISVQLENLFRKMLRVSSLQQHLDQLKQQQLPGAQGEMSAEV
jgi:hypothetical protein